MSQPNAGSDRGSPPSIPRWVKVFGIITLVLILLVVVVVVTGVGGPHGPGRHIPSSNSGDIPSDNTGNSLHSNPGGHSLDIEPVARHT